MLYLTNNKQKNRIDVNFETSFFSRLSDAVKDSMVNIKKATYLMITIIVFNRILKAAVTVAFTPEIAELAYYISYAICLLGYVKYTKHLLNKNK